MKNHYEPRYISKENDRFKKSLFLRDNKKKTLRDYAFEYEKIVLLGNPGVGKTTELKNLFNRLWEEKNENGLIPFYISLKHFRKTVAFDSLILFKDWKKLPSIIFILDGLDEIADIQDFISEFEVFISKNSSLNIKYVISCRTNIYEKYLIRIPDFQTFFLNNLTREQAISILENKHKLKAQNISLGEKHFDYLQTPFFLDLFAGYYKEKSKLPESDSEIWDLYVEKMLEEHKRKQLKKELINTPQLIKDLKKIAFINELMQRNYITEEELNEVFVEKHQNFIENPFFEQYPKSTNWSFIHRQIQEYFAAKSLLDKNSDEILDIVKIDGIESIHPSIFNTISFLINLYDKNSEDYNRLIEWIEQHQIELLFKVDTDRISPDLRIRVFQNYFEAICLDKTFWINSIKSISVDEIARFGDCKENYEYLLEQIKDTNNHPRAIISAIELLDYFTILPDKVPGFKDFFIDRLKGDDVHIAVKSRIIRYIEKQGLCSNNDTCLDEIFEIFRHETSKDLNSSLLFLIKDYHNVERLFDYIVEEFLRAHNLKPRTSKDNVDRGNNYFLRQLILRLKSPHKFLEILQHYLNNELNVYYDNDFVVKLSNKCIAFSNKEEDFIARLLSKIKDETYLHANEQLLRNIIVKSNSGEKAIKYLIANNPIHKIRFFIARIVDAETIDIVSQKIIEEKMPDEEIRRFRNYIGNVNQDKELFKIFQLKMEEEGIEFKKPFLTENDLKKKQSDFRSKTQKNLDTLFDKKLLTDEIKGIFLKNGVGSISNKNIRDIKRKWYEENGHGNPLIDTSIEMAGELVSKNGEFKMQQVEELLADDLLRFNRIKYLIENYESSGWKYDLSDGQKAKITVWSKNTASKEIDYDNLFIRRSRDSFSKTKSYDILRVVLFFQDKFEFELSQDLLLNCLTFFELSVSAVKDDYFLKILSKIQNKTRLNNKVIDNIINNEQLVSFVLSNHIQYALEHKLKAAFPKIREYLKTGGFMYNEEKMIEKYVEVSGDYELLEECCEDINNHLCWSAIHILTKKSMKEELCIAKSIAYTDSGEETYLSDAIGTLFQWNHIQAVKYLLQFLQQGRSSPFSNYPSNYSAIEDYNTLKELYNIIYKEDFDSSDFGHVRPFYDSYITNISKNENGYKKTQDVLNRIKGKLKTNPDSDLFYINLFIENSKKSYINSKSEPYEFEEALKEVEKILS